jgi:hypothetical protein
MNRVVPQRSVRLVPGGKSWRYGLAMTAFGDRLVDVFVIQTIKTRWRNQKLVLPLFDR